MRKLVVLSILIICIQVTCAQKKDTIYYDLNWKGVSTMALATYMRIVYKSSDLQNADIVKDFYISGKLQSEGFIPVSIDKTDNKKSKFKGHAISYYKSGKIQSESSRNDSCQLEGEYVYYFQNGFKMLSGTFKKGKKDGEFTEYYATGNKKQVINYQQDSLPEATNYDENGMKLSTGFLKDGQWEGEFTNYENGIKKSKGTLMNGKWQGTYYQYNADGSYCEIEMIDGEPKNDYLTIVDLEGRRIKIKNNAKK